MWDIGRFLVKEFYWAPPPPPPGRLLGPSKKKDGLKSRDDLVQFSLRSELHPKLRLNGKHYLPPASYSLTVEEKKHSINVSVGCEYP
jgi:hypothetical protein